MTTAIGFVLAVIFLAVGLMSLAAAQRNVAIVFSVLAILVVLVPRLLGAR